MNAEIPPNERVEEPPARSARPIRNDGPMWGGIVLIVLGGYFLLNTLGLIEALRLPFDNWWAIFILIPVVAMGREAWRSYKATGDQFTSKVRNQLIGMLFLFVVFTVFIFDLDWGKIWPVFLILLGVAALARSVVVQID